jgi:hypothetical protein
VSRNPCWHIFCRFVDVHAPKVLPSVLETFCMCTLHVLTKQKYTPCRLHIKPWLLSIFLMNSRSILQVLSSILFENVEFVIGTFWQASSDYHQAHMKCVVRARYDGMFGSHMGSIAANSMIVQFIRCISILTLQWLISAISRMLYLFTHIRLNRDRFSFEVDMLCMIMPSQFCGNHLNV